MGLSDHSLILKNNGTLWGCGKNDYGQLGLGDTTNRTTFTQITKNTDNVKEVYSGLFHSFILKNDGTLWACGNNYYSQLGMGDSSNKYTFTQVTTNADNIKSISCGGYHTIILKNDGTLWGIGWNSSYQLGIGSNSNRATFTQITTNVDNVKEVYCGYANTFILKNDGTLWACGHNGFGQLGLSNTSNATYFTKVTINTNDIKQIYCGVSTFILKNDGTLWGCGKNDYGQLGLGDTTNRTTFTQITKNTDNVKEVYCGGNYTFILKNDGTLWSCGINDRGQLGLGDNTNRNIFTKVLTNVEDIKKIYCAGGHIFILENDGTLWGCGNNVNGQLGIENSINKNIFAQIAKNMSDIKFFPNENKDIKSILKIYDSGIGLIETLDTNNFRNIPVNKFEKIKVLYTNPDETFLNCLISFDQKQTWKTFNGTNWTTVSNITPNDVLMNGMGMKKVNELDKNKLIAGGFTGDIDFLIAMKTNDNTKTPSVTKIYIEYKKDN